MLLIEPDMPLRNVISEVLGNHGYAVVAAGSLREADDKLSAQPIDVIVCDAYVSGHSLGKLTREVARRGQSIVVLGADGDAAARDSVLSQGAARYLIKPVTGNQLRNAVDAARTAPAPDHQA